MFSARYIRPLCSSMEKYYEKLCDPIWYELDISSNYFQLITSLIILLSRAVLRKEY